MLTFMFSLVTVFNKEILFISASELYNTYKIRTKNCVTLKFRVQLSILVVEYFFYGGLWKNENIVNLKDTSSVSGVWTELG